MLLSHVGGTDSIQMQNTTLYSHSIVVFQVTHNTSLNKRHVKIDLTYKTLHGRGSLQAKLCHHHHHRRLISLLQVC